MDRARLEEIKRNATSLNRMPALSEIVELAEIALASTWREITPENLPKKGDEVLFNVPGCYGVEKGYFDGRLWVSDRTGSYDEPMKFTHDEVTHWMPLPNPPEAR